MPFLNHLPVMTWLMLVIPHLMVMLLNGMLIIKLLCIEYWI